MSKKLDHESGCGGCEYFTGEPRNQDGVCRRYPPVAINEDGTCYFTFPSVDVVDWCGEFRRRVT